MQGDYLIYIIECEKPGYFYVGMTNNLNRRIKSHKCGQGSVTTRLYGVISVAVVKKARTLKEALKLERQTYRQLIFRGLKQTESNLGYTAILLPGSRPSKPTLLPGGWVLPRTLQLNAVRYEQYK